MDMARLNRLNISLEENMDTIMWVIVLFLAAIFAFMTVFENIVRKVDRENERLHPGDEFFGQDED